MPQAKDAFEFYREYVKPLYCEIEARDNTLPVELLFEIHAAFDHLRRYFVDGENEATAVHKAISHLKRGALDAFKLKLKFFHDDFQSLVKSDVDFDLVDNGKFLPNLLADKDKIINLAKQSRLSESIDDPAKAFELWSSTSLAINDFYATYMSDQNKIEWARKKTFKLWNKDTRKGIVIGLITGLASSYLIWWITK